MEDQAGGGKGLKRLKRPGFQDGINHGRFSFTCSHGREQMIEWNTPCISLPCDAEPFILDSTWLKRGTGMVQICIPFNPVECRFSAKPLTLCGSL